MRNCVFEIINTRLPQIRIDSLIIEKRKTISSLRKESKFYPRMFKYLLSYVIGGYNLNLFQEIIVFTDSLPVQKKKRAIEKAIKEFLTNKLPREITYHIFHHASKSNHYLQIADYCNWAIYRKWERQDLRSYEIIKGVVKSEFDIFRKGPKCYY